MAAPHLVKPPISAAVQGGIKFALAGTVALSLALWLGLDEPEWAVTTAFVLSTPKFVGAIGEKTVLRIGGAVAGALIGSLLVAELLPHHTWLFLLAMGLLTSFTTTMYGGSLMPYGFRQCGYTATLVAAGGLLHPTQAWEIGLARCGEICLGIAVTMPLTTALWPRYAQVEFVKDARETLGTLARIFREQMGATASSGTGGVLEKVGSRFAKLRLMIRLGGMESRRFRRRKPQVDKVVAQLGALSTALSNFGRTLAADSVYRAFLAGQLDPLLEALARTMEKLADPEASRTERKEALDEATTRLRGYQARLSEFRATHQGDHATVDESLGHAGHALAVHEIHDALRDLGALLPVVEKQQARGLPGFHMQPYRKPDREAITGGVRGGITIVLGLILLDWLRLPGGSIMLVGMYLFTVIAINSPDRRGDLGSFRALGWVLPACGVYWLGLILLAPLLTNVVVLFLVLGVMLFAAGHAWETGRMSPYGSMVGLVMIAVLVNLHSSQPVTPRDIAGPMTGLVLAVLVSTVIRRFLWPVLPQKTYRADLAGLRGLLAQLAAAPDRAAPMAQRAEIALYAAECGTLIGEMEKLGAMDGERAGQHRGYLRALARLGGHLISTTGSARLPQEALACYQEGRAGLLAAVDDLLRGQERILEGQEHCAEAVTLPPIRDWTTRCRSLIRAHTAEDLPTYLSLGLLYRIEQVAACAEEAGRMGVELGCGEKG